MTQAIHINVPIFARYSVEVTEITDKNKNFDGENATRTVLPPMYPGSFSVVHIWDTKMVTICEVPLPADKFDSDGNYTP